MICSPSRIIVRVELYFHMFFIVVVLLASSNQQSVSSLPQSQMTPPPPAHTHTLTHTRTHSTADIHPRVVCAAVYRRGCRMPVNSNQRARLLILRHYECYGCRSWRKHGRFCVFRVVRPSEYYCPYLLLVFSCLHILSTPTSRHTDCFGRSGQRSG
jgi:hypothetical protein